MSKVTITTPEHIELEYELAGIGTRFLGAFVDIILQSAIIAILYMITMLASPDVTSYDILDIVRSSFNALVMVVIFFISFGYYIFFETIWSGQTPGKRIAQCQVIKENGEPVEFVAALLRNIFRIIDFMPYLYVVGLLIIIFHKRNKRLGDIVAGTIVVRIKPDVTPPVLPDLKVQTAIEIDVSAISEDDYNLIRNFIIRRDNLTIDVRKRLAEKISKPLIERMNLESSSLDIEEFLEAAALQYRERKKLL